MNYNFDEVIERRGTQSLKYDTEEKLWGRNDLLPLWVADMDFRTPPFVVDAIRLRLEHEILGYTVAQTGYYKAFSDWTERRYGMHLQNGEVHYIPGIVPGIYMLVNALTAPDDKIMIQPPVYHPFRQVIEATGRRVVNNQLVLDNGRFKMDYNSMLRDIKGCKLFILCNPHNPGGRVWSKEELAEVAEICDRNGTIVISDEIHADMVFSPMRHLPFAISSNAARANSITLMAPTKTFNMPGVISSQAIVFDDELRRKLFSYLDENHIAGGNVFAFLAAESAYTHGEEWLEQMLAYVRGNISYIDEFLKNNTPRIKAMIPEASFLLFLDCRELGFSNQEELNVFFVDKAHLGLNSGTMFGPGGEGWMRLNVASPRSVIAKAMTQLKDAYRTL
ncbi:MAG: MalY/PatB family protein [Bacteroidales bacterium]